GGRPLMRGAALALAIVGLAGCGGGDGAVHVAFQRHALTCDIPDLQAELEVSNGMICPLTVNDDRTVEGTCARVPTGRMLTFRLAYFVTLENAPNPECLAIAVVDEDLRGYSKSQLTIVFPAAKLQSDIVDDD